MLNSTYYDGPSGQTPLLIAHGLFGSARNWNVIAKRVSTVRPVRVVDMRNHGESPWYDTHSYHDLAQDLEMVLDQPHHVLGHSMGGKAAMVLALQKPECVAKLIVADIAPVPYTHTQTKPLQAMKSLDLSRVVTRADARVQMQDLPAGLPDFLLQSLDLSTKTWRLNLAALETEMSKIVGFPEVSGQFERDVLFLKGAQSRYIQPEYHEKMHAYFPRHTIQVIESAGHWLHAEQPRAFEAALNDFLT